MKGREIDVLRHVFKKPQKQNFKGKIKFMNTMYGTVRYLDTGDESNEVIINAPDGPNVIEHHEKLICELSKKFRVVCFEFPGTGFSYPNLKYGYSLEDGVAILFQVMDLLEIQKASLLLSCSNGLYGIMAAQTKSSRVNYLFLSQTCSLDSFDQWSNKSIPKMLRYPYFGQVVNLVLIKKLTEKWYQYSLPKTTNKSKFESLALNAIDSGACFCLSSLVQGLQKGKNSLLKVTETPSVLFWGKKDYTHRKTSSYSITEHLPNCEIIELPDCGHFPELENTKKYLEIVFDRLEK